MPGPDLQEFLCSTWLPEVKLKFSWTGDPGARVGLGAGWQHQWSTHKSRHKQHFWGVSIYKRPFGFAITISLKVSAIFVNHVTWLVPVNHLEMSVGSQLSRCLLKNQIIFLLQWNLVEKKTLLVWNRLTHRFVWWTTNGRATRIHKETSEGKSEKTKERKKERKRQRILKEREREGEVLGDMFSRTCVSGTPVVYASTPQLSREAFAGIGGAHIADPRRVSTRGSRGGIGRRWRPRTLNVTWW